MTLTTHQLAIMNGCVLGFNLLVLLTCTVNPILFYIFMCLALFNAYSIANYLVSTHTQKKLSHFSFLSP